MSDFGVQTAARNREREPRGQVASKVHGSSERWKAVTYEFRVGMRLPADKLTRAARVDLQTVTPIKMLHNAAIVQSEVIAIVLLLADAPPFLRGHLLGQLENDWLAVDEDSIEVKNG